MEKKQTIEEIKQKQPFLSNKQKGKSEEQINTAKITAAEILKKSLKIKSHSQTTIRVGPFAAIREAETERRRRQNGGSMDEDELEGNSELKASMSEETFTINNNKKINKNINREIKN